jgi:glycosyltransferase involved in cell wall biosynthesis
MPQPLAPPPKISVLIPAYNEERLIGQVLDSVHESFASCGNSAYEIIVCDNNSTDRTALIAAEKKAQVVFEPHNQIARARNAAASRATGEWFIFLDGDTLLNAELLRETVETLSQGEVCGGGAGIRFDRTNIGAVARGLTKFWNWVSTTFNLAAGSYLFCLRDAWKDTGGFDENVYAGEEIFFSRRVKHWGKSRGFRFRILRTSSAVTSARKMEWYGPWELLWYMILMLRPKAMNRRESCALWYTRPVSSSKADE